MARIAGVDLPKNKRIEIGLTYIYGIGREMHEDPEVPNYGKPGHGMRLMPGMTFCIEPMINGKGDAVRVLGDGWTVVTRSGSLAAHFEHEIAVTQDGPVILTRP